MENKILEIIDRSINSCRKEMVDCIFDQLMKDLVQLTINHVASKIKIGEKIDIEEVIQDIKKFIENKHND